MHPGLLKPLPAVYTNEFDILLPLYTEPTVVDTHKLRLSESETIP